jgi:hypothetical protein
MRHDFVITLLPRRGERSRCRYRYVCLRCRWTFLVWSDALVRAVDHRDQPLPEPEAARRLATFALGPCPGLAARHTGYAR